MLGLFLTCNTFACGCHKQLALKGDSCCRALLCLPTGVARNTPEKLRAWVEDPEAMKPGALMPPMKLSRDELTQLTAYLLTLR